METKPSRINEARAVEALASLYVRVAVSLLNIHARCARLCEMRGTRMYSANRRLHRPLSKSVCGRSVIICRLATECYSP